VVDQSVTDRTNAAAVAFQAARAGAQAIDPAAARAGVIALDPTAARRAVDETVARLLSTNGDTGSVQSVTIEARRVTVAVTITSTGRPATGVASATAVPGIRSPLP
jgi:O-acetyl-ADP-ribose deacetylase (regulator of RNase III)